MFNLVKSVIYEQFKHTMIIIIMIIIITIIIMLWNSVYGYELFIVLLYVLLY